MRPCIAADFNVMACVAHAALKPREALGTLVGYYDIDHSSHTSDSMNPPSDTISQTAITCLVQNGNFAS